ncbi:MAG: 2-oxoacid:acceptor oxidoreductase family protein, partial [Planctomycetota bacterium]
MPQRACLDGNDAVARIAYATNEIAAIYPITPSSSMGELSDQWAAAGKRNLWGQPVLVQEMQSEGGAAGAIHGALQTGSLTTTFTASQGLLLMIPNMYKIAGELTSTVFHVSARSLAAQALSIFGDHSDVMAARGTGFAMLCANGVQEAHDCALISQAATLESRVPFMHFFDGFRTSHEVGDIELIDDAVIRALIDDDLVLAHRARALDPDHPVIRGTAQNPDVYFQGREAVNPFYAATPGIVQQTMDRFAALTGRAYRIMDYHGDPAAERVVIAMGSACDTLIDTVDALRARGERVGMVSVRLYRPFSAAALVAALPATVTHIAVLDRCKEPGAGGEPLYLDVSTALSEAYHNGDLSRLPRAVGGRYGLSSKEFTPAMAAAVFANLRTERPRNHFTIGINDDVSHSSLSLSADDRTVASEDPDSVRALFYGLGSDGTVGANKNSIKIIGEQTDHHAQGYFVYDSKKSGSQTVSHLRFGPQPIRRPYLIDSATFVACHQFSFLNQIDVLEHAADGAVL